VHVRDIVELAHGWHFGDFEKVEDGEKDEMAAD
jgi:hypothetical protein